MKTIKKVEIIEAKKDIKETNDTKVSILRVSPYIRVSTNDIEQKNSYESQIKHYTNVIENNPEWELGEIYADEGISGTQVKKRDDFKRMIHDALEGKIDMIITKSISRFARNTEDTLKYVRMLKEKGIAIVFEKENINTLTMNGELLLTILSSLAQQESESISANVKMGIKMKMKRGEIVGMPQCLGYDYNKKTKQITINKKESEIVKYIFKRYVEGAGGYVIAKELTNKKSWKTKKGNEKWDATSVLNIIKNEKYVGDLLLGKNITTDPITHRKIKNMGEEEKYLVKNHHEPIIDRELFNQANEILSKRSKQTKNKMKKRGRYSRKHAFSSITKCGYCGTRTTRRRWHKGKPYEKFVWRCANYLNNGKESCPESKGVDEEMLKIAFVQTYNKLQENDMETIREFIDAFSKTTNSDDYNKELKEINNSINKLEQKLNKLIDMKLDDMIDDNIYKHKHEELIDELETLKNAKAELENANVGRATINKRIAELKIVLQKQDKIMKEFDRDIFDKIVDEVILGHENEDGEFDPYTIIFKLKTGLKYVNEIVFNESETGGRKSYADCRINTTSITKKDTVLTLDFTYNFGYSKYSKKQNYRQGKQKIKVMVVI